MHRTYRLCRMLLLGSSVAAPAALHAQFEGTITFVSHDRDEGDQTFTQWLKGPRTRVDMRRPARNGEEPENGSVIFDGTAKTMSIIMHDRKMYMQSPLAATGSKPMEMDDDERKELKASKWTKTGKSESVAGTSCEIWHGTTVEEGKRKEADVCLAKGVGFMMGAGIGGARNPFMAAARRFSGIGAGEDMGVLKMTSYEGGKSRVELEATKIEKKSVADSEFLPPAGYKKFAPMGPPPKP